ncbi:MAG: PIN domain-containing protein [Solirubrobacteraceae bacterium]
MTTPLSLLDTSVWSRLRDGRVAGAHAERVAARIEGGELATTEPLLLEMRYFARNAEDFALLAEELDALPLLPLDGTAIQRALDAQAQMAADKRVSHRVKPIDLLVAGVADRHEAAILHYDGDYDLIAKHTDLSFDSVWVAKRGSAG